MATPDETELPAWPGRDEDKVLTPDEAVAVARYYLNRNTNFAEVSYLVRDDYQKRGIGSFVVRYIARIARENGIAGFDAEILSDNPPAMRVLHKLGFPVETTVAGGNYHLRVKFERVVSETPA